MLRGARNFLRLVVLCMTPFTVQAQSDSLAHQKNEIQLREISVTHTKESGRAKQQTDGSMVLGQAQIYSLPALLGEHDPIRAVQMLPGVQSGNEGARGIFIRGGSPDQTLLLLDGAPVYNPSHLYGFISVFNADAVEQVHLYKDSYPSRYGGRLSSVVDVTANGGDTTLKGVFSLGIITSRFHLEGPLTPKKKTTFAVSLRGCYAGLFSGPLSKKQFESAGSSGSIKYFFGDANFKLVHRFSQRTKAELSFFTNSDYYSFEQRTHTDSSKYREDYGLKQSIYWNNYVASLRVLHVFNEQWQMRQTVAFSNYQISTTEKQWQTYNYFVQPTYNSNTFSNSKHQSYVRDLSWRADVSFKTAEQTFKTGAGFVNRWFETGRLDYDLQNDFNGHLVYRLNGTQINTQEVFLYAEDEYRPDKRWLINGGFHVNLYVTEKKVFPSFLPRLNIIYNPVAEFYLRASAAGLQQNLHLLTAASSNILNDHWVPATNTAAPETGWNFSAGMQHKLPQHFEWSIDGFYRIMNNVIDYKNGADQTSFYKAWQTQIVTAGTARSYGAEFYIARTAGRITGSISYSLAWSQRKFEGENHNQYFPYKYDRRHNLAAQINYRFAKNFEVGLAYVYGSGNTFTLPLQTYHSFGVVHSYNHYLAQGVTNPSQNDLINVYGGRNNARLPSYQHLDFSFTFRKRIKKLEHSFNLSVYNVYNHFNIFTIYAQRTTQPDGTLQVTYKKVSLLPVIPSVSYTIKF